MSNEQIQQWKNKMNYLESIISIEQNLMNPFVC